MVGLPYDCLANPLGAVRLTFEKAVALGSDPAGLDGKDWGAADLFRQFLFDESGLAQVPMLSPSTIKWVQPNTLVRFRGMIQDMLGNEFYVGAYKDGDVWRTNKYVDASQCSMSASSEMRIWERCLLYCIPVPGQNSWAESSDEVTNNPYKHCTPPQREKRQREDEITLTDIDIMDPDHSLEDSPTTKKMREDHMDLDPVNLQMNLAEELITNSNSVSDAGRTSFSCLVKIYDSPEAEVKLNDVFEFIGIFTFDPDLVMDRDGSEETIERFGENALDSLPPSKVPRLHCIVHRKLVVDDFLSSPPLEFKPPAIRGLREPLLGHLAAVLGNDRMAAEYLLLHLLSKYLNSVSLAPKKDYSTDRLAFGVLQLAEGSHLTIDEVSLEAGTLNSTGVENALVLKNLMEFQKVEYDFTYYKMDMATDVQLLILSEGKSNILPADIVLPVHPCSTDSSLEVDGELLRAWRWYFATMKSLPHSIEPHMQKIVEDDLVAARQADRSLGSQEFSRWLTMGRLMSISFGETCLSMEHWQMVRELEQLRKARLLGNM